MQKFQDKSTVENTFLEFIDHGNDIIEVSAKEKVINTSSDLLDILAETRASVILLRSENINEDFFKLSTGLAGEMLQKISNYRLKMGIIGDFTSIKSKALHDLIYECNKTKQIVFVRTIEEAIALLRD